MPTKAELKAIQNPTASEVYTVDGKLLGKYFLENRTNVSINEISPHIINALIATEDERFYDHNGVDLISLFRVFFKNILLGEESAGGGSTISQQLAKNLYPRQTFSFASLFINKIREIAIAQQLERIYDKESILALYLNTVPFTDNAFGIEVACHRFFSVSATDVRQEEAAVLVGMLKAPTVHNPRLYPERALARRNVVLQRMDKNGYLKPGEMDSLMAIPLDLDYSYLSHNQGLAPYFREHLRLELVQWCKTHFKPDGSPYNLYTDGLRITTTLHSEVQKIAEKAVYDQMQKTQRSFDRHTQWSKKNKNSTAILKDGQRKSPRYYQLKKAGKSEAEIDSIFQIPIPMSVFDWEGEQSVTMSPWDSIRYNKFLLHAGFIAMEPLSGHIRAWVGGINHAYFQYDHVTANRQTGSIFKPLVYAAALETGVSPCEYITNEQTVYTNYDNWSPRNSDDQYGGEYSMQGALTHSVNVAAVNMIMKIKPRKVVDLANTMGITKELPAVPSLALGTAELSLMDMARAYGCMVNGGYFVEPTYVLRIEDARGEMIRNGIAQKEPKQILSEGTSAMLIKMLQNVVDQGTGRGLRTRFGLQNDLAGKTGTTQSQADGWFVGVSPDLVAGAWVGADDRRIHFRSLSMGQGARTALPIVGQFLKDLYKAPDFAYMKEGRFPTPSRKIMEAMDCDEFWFPMSMSVFKEWWAKQKLLEELKKEGEDK